MLLLILQLSLFQLLFAGIPLLCLSLYRKSLFLLKLIPVLFAILLLDLLALFFRPLELPLYWNWQGKFFEFLWPLIIVFGLRWMSPKEVGYSVLGEKSSWLIAACFGLGVGLFSFILNWVFPSDKMPPYPLWETIAFQATLPGLAEEPVYRGILLALFDRHFNKPWMVFKTKVGWGVILTTLMFSAVHVLSISRKDMTFIWDPVWVFPNILWAFAFGWLKERSGSLWPCIFAHNLTNTLSILFVY